MLPLDKTLRNKLEKTVIEARLVSESGALAALQQLGVREATAYKNLTEQERVLRRKLRAHARHLGNGRNADGVQEIDRLIEEVAYEHWHRMLFARFLAENNLLMYPDPVEPVAVSLEECEDLAADEGAANSWELAARYAAHMLPQIFRPDSPVFKLSLPPEHQQKLERLVADLPEDVFTASDSLGWVYQFWQARKKEEVNASEVKIGARELTAVTQLFTEPYMVAFLLDNSLGAWWVRQCTMGSVQSSNKARQKFQSAEGEDELREFFSRPGFTLSYLRFVKTEQCTLTINGKNVFEGEHWMPASGWYENWPDSLKDFKTLDPCCGSGHFLVALFVMLAAMRIELENLSAREAVDMVLSENIHGLEIDQRCVALAAFALALAAWTYPGAGGYRPLPELNIACSGLAINPRRDEWLALAKDDVKLRYTLDQMYDLFKNAPVLGSLINPGRISDQSAWSKEKYELAVNRIQHLLSREKQDLDCFEMGVVAQGISRASTLLADKYHFVVTNVPYLSRGKQDELLKEFCQQYYKEAKNDLATVFLDRCLEYCKENDGLEQTKSGSVSLVLPQNWLFLTTYKKFREKLLKKHTWRLIARLGPGAFETISGEVVKAILLSISRGCLIRDTKNIAPSKSPNDTSGYILGIDVSAEHSSSDKSITLIKGRIKKINQMEQLSNPDVRVMLDDFTKGKLLELYTSYNKGVCTGDDPHYRQKFWEQSLISNVWKGLQSTVKKDQHFGGISDLLLWENGSGSLHSYIKERLGGSVGAWLRGQNAWSKDGVTIQCMNNLPAELYMGQAFDSNVVTITPKEKRFQKVLWTYMSSPNYKTEVRKLNQKMNVGDDTFIKVPFDLNHWTKVAQEKYPHGLPKPYSDDPTQWIFHGHPCGSVIWDEDKKWTAHGPLRVEANVLHVAMARLLGYQWPAELDESMELADEQRYWVEKSKELVSLADEDGIVCIPPVRGESAAVDRLFAILVRSYGSGWSNNVLGQLLAESDHSGKTLETWLRDKFFAQHCRLFHHRPFIWQIWDGLRDGFSALVNYHKLDFKNLETLTYTYLGDWIARQKQAITDGVDGAEEKLAAARNLKKKLELILEGEKPYDIFVRWKPIEKQPIGWNPDINDGVRLNIRPFMSVSDVGRKGAGILRDKPNINWNKDRGKDVKSAPWFHLFKGDRINDHHLSLDDKIKSRKQSK